MSRHRGSSQTSKYKRHCALAVKLCCCRNYVRAQRIKSHKQMKAAVCLSCEAVLLSKARRTLDSYAYILRAFVVGYAGEYHSAMQPGVQDGCLTFSTTKEGSNPAAHGAHEDVKPCDLILRANGIAPCSSIDCQTVISLEYKTRRIS